MKQKNSIMQYTREGRTRIVSTILIPKEYWLLFKERKNELDGNTSSLIEYLLKRNQSDKMNLVYPLVHTYGGRSTTIYQNTASSLRKHSFSIHPLVWQRFKCLARSQGLSTCCLFVSFLLSLSSIKRAQ